MKILYYLIIVICFIFVSSIVLAVEDPIINYMQQIPVTSFDYGMDSLEKDLMLNRNNFKFNGIQSHEIYVRYQSDINKIEIIFHFDTKYENPYSQINKNKEEQIKKELKETMLLIKSHLGINHQTGEPYQIRASHNPDMKFYSRLGHHFIVTSTDTSKKDGILEKLDNITEIQIRFKLIEEPIDKNFVYICKSSILGQAYTFYKQEEWGSVIPVTFSEEEQF